MAARMIDKFFASAEAALADIPDGATIMIGGFGNAGMPAALIDALIAQGARGLTIVNNNAGNADSGLAALIAAKRVRKILCSFPRQADSWHFDKLYRAGEIALELVPDRCDSIRAASRSQSNRCSRFEIESPLPPKQSPASAALVQKLSGPRRIRAILQQVVLLLRNHDWR